MPNHHHLTPSEDLMMDALAARYRLGEHLWPFRNDQCAIANRLEAKGLIWVTSGQVESSFRAGLTEAGIAKCIDPNYTPPNERRGHGQEAGSTLRFELRILVEPSGQD